MSNASPVASAKRLAAEPPSAAPKPFEARPLPMPIGRPIRSARRLRTIYTQEQTDLAIHRERCRADRTGQPFSLVVFRMPRSIGPSRSLLRLARVVLDRGRGTDDVGWYDDDTVCALLPDTAGEGASRFADNVAGSFEDPVRRPQVTIYTYPGAAAATAAAAPSASAPSASALSASAPSAPSASASPRTAAELMPYVSRGLTESLAARGHLPNGGVAVASLAAGALAGPAPSPDAVPMATEAGVGLNPARPLAVLLARPMPWWKRAMDVAGSLFGLVIFAPVFAAAALTIKLGDGGPVFFCQRRAGLGGRPFRICKFRTMCVDAEAKKQALRAISEQDGPAFKLKRDPRITRVGHLLRKTSLDELPQLWNVLRGDMSLVGPRPLPLDEQGGAERWQQTRLDVTPGLTCVWQVKGRSTVTFAEWVRMDVGYIRQRTLWTDVKILAQTVPAVLLRRGAR